MDRCEDCEAVIDTDDALDCYREVNIERMGFSSAYTFDIACICDTCWGLRNAEPEPEDLPGFFDTDRRASVGQ